MSEGGEEKDADIPFAHVVLFFSLGGCGRVNDVCKERKISKEKVQDERRLSPTRGTKNNNDASCPHRRGMCVCVWCVLLLGIREMVRSSSFRDGGGGESAAYSVLKSGR